MCHGQPQGTGASCTQALAHCTSCLPTSCLSRLTVDLHLFQYPTISYLDLRMTVYDRKRELSLDAIYCIAPGLHNFAVFMVIRDM